ncbi:MAG: TRAP transporter substrate-binding protein [Proteobacteria bacterium]|nr:TRAP transporter substrate-binding protein [Pseudomonadota bacterium]
MRKLFCMMLLLSNSIYAAEEEFVPEPLKVMGSWSMLSQFKDYEKPFWTTQLPALSEGRIKVNLNAFNDVGLKGSEVLRLMKLGLIDFGTTILSYVSEQDPRAEAVDLAGLTLDLTMERRVVDSYKPVLDRYFEQKHGIKVLAMWPYAAQFLMCNSPIKNLEGLKGKKVRVSMRTTSDLIEAYGAITLSIPFDQVYTQMKDKQLDCLITSALAAHSARFYQVASNIYHLPLGWSMVMLGVNQVSWAKIEAQDQKIIETGVTQLANDLWQAADTQTALGIACNTGKNCSLAEQGTMTLIKPSSSDEARLAKTVKQVVLKRWAERCGKECVAEWNDSIGKTLNITLHP